ncbi:hypothetical protein IMCC9480_352 [Oxalobacteraceae bacterium IMCC9480]|nr:hypothetical protein IMCC9480_352 [Oxalobacteraceae bacterium IMCC9480]
MNLSRIIDEHDDPALPWVTSRRQSDAPLFHAKSSQDL